MSFKSIVLNKYEEVHYLSTDAMVDSIKDGLKWKVQYNGYSMKKGGRTEATIKISRMAAMKSILYGSDEKYFVWQKSKVLCMATMKSIEEGRPLLKDCFRRCHSLSLIRHGQD